MFACMSYNQWLRTVWKWCFCCCFRSLAYNYVQHSYGSFLCQDIFSDRFFFPHFPIILVTLIYGYGNFFIDKRGFIQVVKSHCEIVNIKIGEMYWNVAIFDPHRSIDFIQRESGLIHNHTDFSFRLVSFETRSGLNMFVTKWTLPFIWLKRNTFFALILHGIHTN